MSSDVRFWDKIADKYSKSPVKDVPSYEHTLERTREYLKPTDRVVELGSGTGTTALKLSDAVAHITASDLAPAMSEIGRGKAKDQGVENVEFATGDVPQIMAGGPYDVVLAFNLLHLVPDLAGDLKAVRAGMEPGQMFISKSTCLGGKPLIRLVIGFMQLVGKAPFLSYFTIEELEHAIRKAGFEIVETGTFPKNPPARFVVAKAI